MPLAAATAAAWVPFPAPGGPNKSTASIAPLLLEYALVVTHRQLRLHLPHCVERHAHHDQDRRTSQSARGGLREPAVADEEVRQHRDQPEEDRAGQRQAREHAVEVARGGRTGTDARN